MITDDFMRQMLASSKIYSLVLLRGGPNVNQPGIKEIIWEHGRRNFQLRASGIMSIVGPIAKDNEIAGVCIFNASAEETARIMEEDPAVKAGIFVYEVLPFRSFPGDALGH